MRYVTASPFGSDAMLLRSMSVRRPMCVMNVGSTAATTGALLATVPKFAATSCRSVASTVPLPSTSAAAPAVASELSAASTRPSRFTSPASDNASV